MSINLSYDITGSITKCHNASLVHLWFLRDFFLPFFIFSLKLMNMQIRQFELLTTGKKGQWQCIRSKSCSLV